MVDATLLISDEWVGGLLIGAPTGPFFLQAKFPRLKSG